MKTKDHDILVTLLYNRTMASFCASFGAILLLSTAVIATEDTNPFVQYEENCPTWDAHTEMPQRTTLWYIGSFHPTRSYQHFGRHRTLGAVPI